MVRWFNLATNWWYLSGFVSNSLWFDHLFLHCPFAMDLWSMVYGFGSFWSNLGYAAHCFGAVTMLASQLWLSSKWLYLVHHCLLWCLWRERNSRCFEDIERSIPDLKLLFFRTLRDWLFALQNQSFPSFIDFLDSCNFCIWFLFPCLLPVY